MTGRAIKEKLSQVDDKCYVGKIEDILWNSFEISRNPSKPFLLSPIDLQSIKAAGVTFVNSMLERVIEEQAKGTRLSRTICQVFTFVGDPSKADDIRKSLTEAIGAQVSSVKPGSPESAKLKQYLIKKGQWSQYMEVGLGEDAEVFTKSQPLSAVGVGSQIGIHPK